MKRTTEQVTGVEAAITEVAQWAKSFEDGNGAGRVQISASGLRAEDTEGSGEFCQATCININDAQSCAEEIYNIAVLA